MRKRCTLVSSARIILVLRPALGAKAALRLVKARPVVVRGIESSNWMLLVVAQVLLVAVRVLLAVELLPLPLTVTCISPRLVVRARPRRLRLPPPLPLSARRRLLLLLPQLPRLLPRLSLLLLLVFRLAGPVLQ